MPKFGWLSMAVRRLSGGCQAAVRHKYDTLNLLVVVEGSHIGEVLLEACFKFEFACYKAKLA